MRGRWWGILWLLASCTHVPSNTNTKNGQPQAVEIVWKQVFHSGDAPPEIRWVEGANLACTDPNSNRPGFPTPNGCREGYTWRESEVQVAWRDDDRFSTTTLAHELLHAFHFHLMIVDPLHMTPGFKPKSACAGPPNPPQDLCGIVEVANDALAAANL